MAWNRSQIPSQRGRVAVVTGANGGLGLETARALAGAGALVILAARDSDKAAAAEADIRRTELDPLLSVVKLDLASLASVQSAAEEITKAHSSIDILVNNAGVMAIPERQTADGFEVQFGINHLGHFALSARLLPNLIRADAARVVTVTSYAHHLGNSVDPENAHLHGNYSEWSAYSQSKLANYHFGIGLHRILRRCRARPGSLLAHPGLSNTNLQANSVTESGGASQRFWHVLAERTGMSASKGALPQLRAATDPSAKSGQLFAPRFLTNGPPVRRPILRLGSDEAIRRLWEVSERETGTCINDETVRSMMSA
jgi:NAD(P)-dependent dehydrogenase (short-subunit alcohol dehydrogenase family)